MKRIIVREYGDESVLVAEKSDAPKPGVNEILIRLYAAGLNPVDTYRRAGSQGYRPDLPFCPGVEGAGEILAIGPRTAAGSPAEGQSGSPSPATAPGEPMRAAAPAFDFAVGDRVYVAWSKTGTYADWTIAESDQVFPLPPGLSFEAGAGLFVAYFTAYRALVLRGQAQPGERILVRGASGGVGTAAVQWALFKGFPVWGTAGSNAGLAALRSTGLQDAADHRDDTAVADMAKRVGNFDVILEMRADLNLESDLEMLRPGGRVVVVGSKGSLQITPRKTMSPETDIRGMALFNNSAEENLLIHRELVKGLASGDIRPNIGASYLLENVQEALREMMQTHGAGKRILTMSEV